MHRNMKRVFGNRRVQRALGLLLVLSVGLVGCAWYFRIWSWHDFQVYGYMSHECHPVWRDLHWGRIRAGDDVDAVIATTNPARVEHYGDFTVLNYQEGFCFGGITLIAKNRRLMGAGAWSCCWQREFFDELTRMDRKAFDDAYVAHWQPIRKKREEAELAVGIATASLRGF